MSELTVVQALEKAWSFIDAPEKWTKGAFARDKQGNPVNPLWMEATCFCSVGALRKALNMPNDTSVTPAVYKQCTVIFPTLFDGSLMQLNDGSNHHLLSYYWGRAIAVAKQKEQQRGQSFIPSPGLPQ